MLVDPYSADKKFRNFPGLDTAIRKYYDYLLDFVPTDDLLLMTPRYQIEHGLRIGYRDIFYYIDRLYDYSPESVIDVGCGECIWKKWFPNIVGFDPTPATYSNHDFVDYFDQDFSHGHKENWDCGMALNSMHFITWTQITEQINLAMNIIRPSGRFLFTFNFNKVDESSKNMKNYNFAPEKKIVNLSLEEKVKHMDNLINNSGFRVVLKDYPLLHGVIEKQDNLFCHLNGHVRFILEK